MAEIYRNGAFAEDSWRVLGPEEALPESGPVLLSKARFTEERQALAGRNAPIGLVLEPNDSLSDLGDELARFPVIAVRFPKFADGRGFSIARLLRERHGYDGEIRAIGEVLIDQIPFMFRVGFTALDVTHAPTRAALEAGHVPSVPFYYQPAADSAAKPPAGRPWLRTAV